MESMRAQWNYTIRDYSNITRECSTSSISFIQLYCLFICLYVCLFIQPSLPLSYSEAAGTGIEVEVVDDLDDEVAASLVGFVFLIMSACLIFILWMYPCPWESCHSL